jgi:hypothetical protein
MSTTHRRAARPGADFAVEGSGTVALVRPLSEGADEWLHREVEGNAMWFGGAVAVDRRYLLPIVRGLAAAGFRRALVPR